MLQVFDELLGVGLIPNYVWVSGVPQLYTEDQSHGNDGLLLNVRKRHEGEVNVML